MRLTLAHLDMATAALRAVLPLKFPADAILRNFFRENPKLGESDRAFCAETIFVVSCATGFFLKMPLPAPRRDRCCWLIWSNFTA